MKRVLVALAMAASVALAETEEKAERAATAASVGFTTLPLCRLAEGSVEVQKAGGEWMPAEEGRFYPLGASYRTGADGRLVLAFGAESSVTLAENSAIATREQALGQTSRTVQLVSGTVTLKLAENTPEGAFFVTAPGFTVKNPAGESRFVYEDKGDGDVATVRCVTGSLGLDGRHFTIPTMRSANEIVIRTSHDHLMTFLYGTSGDYVVRLDQGVRTIDEIGDDGKMQRREEKSHLDWHLSPATKVIISRSVPALGERMSVHTMAFDAAGERKSECAFCEGRAEVNSGELVVREKAEGDELAKRAAEATETTEATDVDEKPAESAAEGNSGNEQ